MIDPNASPPATGGADNETAAKTLGSRETGNPPDGDLWLQLQNRKKRTVTPIRFLLVVALLMALAVLVIGLIIVLM